jgi:hypothetical protein
VTAILPAVLAGIVLLALVGLLSYRRSKHRFEAQVMHGTVKSLSNYCGNRADVFSLRALQWVHGAIHSAAMSFAQSYEKAFHQHADLVG